MTIEDSLTLLNNTKQSIKTAIENKGVTVGSVPFADYAGKIGDIPTGIDLPEVGEEFGGGYFIEALLLSDGVYASIVSPLTGGEVGSRTNGTAAAWGFPAEYLDPRVADSNIPNSQAKTAVNGLTLNGKSDWMLPTMPQAIKWLSTVIQKGWIDDERGIISGLTYYSINTCTENTANTSQFIYAGMLDSLDNVQAAVRNKNIASRTRAFRLEKLD